MHYTLHSPPNETEVKQIWAFISVDSGGEGICAAVINGVTFPMVTASESNLAHFTATAELLAKRSGKTIKLIKLTAREDIREFIP